MICPRWVDMLAQPIAVDDVIAYLVAALDLPVTGDAVFEIGGREVVSYGDLMRRYAELRGLRRLLLPVPVITPHLSGLWLALVTPTQCARRPCPRRGSQERDDRPFRGSAARLSHHADVASGRAEQGVQGRHHYTKVDRRTTIVDVPPAQAFAPIRRIGGSAGWYFGNLWRLRAWLDRYVGGVGMAGGRRDPNKCEMGDSIDGWTVVAYEPERRLRLVAGMKLPGRGWLEFEVTPLDGGQRSRISQTATFDPRGVLGRAYWNAVLLFHAIIFRGMLRNLAHRVHQERPVRISRVAAAVLAALACVGSVMPLFAQSRPAVRTVPSVNLQHYAGEWFEIARFPNRFQRRCVSDVTAQYVRRSDGRLDVINRCRADKGSIEAKGITRTVDNTGAKLKVRFAPAALSFISAVWGDYWVVALADDSRGPWSAHRTTTTSGCCRARRPSPTRRISRSWPQQQRMASRLHDWFAPVQTDAEAGVTTG